MKFKKHISIFLASLVFLANLGYSFTVHYCNETIASISLNENFDEPCSEPIVSCCAVEDSHDNCCSNKTIKVEKSNENVLLKSISFETLNTFIIPNNSVVFSSNQVLNTEIDSPEFYCDTNAPPFYKLYLQYILYA